MLDMADNAATGGAETGATVSGDSAAAAETSTPASTGSTPTGEQSTPNTGSASKFTDGKSATESKESGEKEEDPGKQTSKSDKSDTGKPTPKAVSDAVNKATERANRKIKFYEEREARHSQALKDIGLTGDLDVDAAQILATAKKIPISEAIRRQTATKDAEVLGVADAEDIIQNGGDIELEMKRLINKPGPTRTKRDQYCYNRLAEAKKEADDTASLAELGVDVEKLQSDQKYQDYMKKLNPNLPIAERYEMYKEKYNPSVKGTPPASASSKGQTEKKTSYTSAEVDKMSKEEIAANLDAITRSMKNW